MENLTDQDVTEMVSEAITVLSNETTEHEDVDESANYFTDWSKVLHHREDLVKELVKGSTGITKFEVFHMYYFISF